MFEDIAVCAVGGCTLDRVRECVENATGERLKEAFDDIYGRYFRTISNEQYFTVVKDFSAYPLTDDESVPFSRLPIMVSFEPYKTPPGTEERRELCREIALRVARAIFEELHCDCLVAEDLQRRVATFKSPRNDWIGGGRAADGNLN